MKLKYCLTALLSFFILSAYAQKKLPNVSAKSLNGKVVNLLDTYGQEDDKLTVISFWATWCKPCLLYTSPSPRDLSTSRMPSSA